MDTRSDNDLARRRPCGSGAASPHSVSDSHGGVSKIACGVDSGPGRSCTWPDFMRQIEKIGLGVTKHGTNSTRVELAWNYARA